MPFPTQTIDVEKCLACQEPLNVLDSKSYVSFSDATEDESVHKPLVVFFLFSGDGSIKDNFCLDCFDQFKNMSGFFNKCQSSPRRRSVHFSSDSSTASPQPHHETIHHPPSKFRINPRQLSSDSSHYPSTSTTKSRPRCPSSELLSSVAGTRTNTANMITQTFPRTHVANQTFSPKKKNYDVHHDLGIRLPRPNVKDKGCHSSSDICLSVLKEELEMEERLKGKYKLSLSDEDDKVWEETIDGTKKKVCLNKYPPIFKTPKPQVIEEGHFHSHKCPFCTTMIRNKNV